MITAGEIVFLDTNILLTATDESRLHHCAAKEIFGKIRRHGLHAGISGQVIREYLVVCTRPVEVNGLGMRSDEVIQNIAQFRKYVHIYDETMATIEFLQHLVLHHNLNGKRIHDANIVATMKTNGIDIIVTENSSDYHCFEELQVFTISAFPG